MLVSFLKTGSYDGVGTSAVDYLIDEKDHKGDIRPQVVVLRGDPERTAKTIDFLNFSKRYTSFVLAFEKLDNPSVEQIE